MTPEALVPIIVKALREIPWGERDLWLAQMIVGMVEERAVQDCDNPDVTFLDCINKESHICRAYEHFGLTESDWL